MFATLRYHGEERQGAPCCTTDLLRKRPRTDHFEPGLPALRDLLLQALALGVVPDGIQRQTLAALCHR